MNNHTQDDQLSEKKQISSKYDEKRIFSRRDTHDLAQLIFGVDGKSITCMVHNISESGAMIETSTRDLAKRFILDYPDKNIHSLCQIVWSCCGLTGVEFVKLQTLD